PGAPAIDAPIKDGWLLGQLGDRFQVLAIGLQVDPVDEVEVLHIDPSASPEFTARYLGDQPCAIYLLRPDQHIAARWLEYNPKAIENALKTAIGKG
ncbi:MAG: FAD-dependent oxidoreductase, partial [Rhodobacteraceae bacterium]|nr:FAD-dependent oxidoreductase [Paracoccaceae bacterium]